VAAGYTNGCDFSDYQGVVDWPLFKETGYSFAYIKATQANDYTSPSFENNFVGAQAAGLMTGAYHMYDFAASPTAQLEHFLAAYKPHKGDLPPMVDVELFTDLSQTQCISSLGVFLNGLKRAINALPVIYTYYYYWEVNLGGYDGWSGHPLWIADYTSSSTPDLIPPAWTKWTFWQYTGMGRNPAVRTAVDEDFFNGSYQDLQHLLLP
jgi:lysozyme